MSALITSVVISLASVGLQQSAAHNQRKAVKSAAHAEDVKSQALLAEAEAEEKRSAKTAANAATRARQKALVATTSGSGRAGTIKAGTLGGAVTTEKSITGG